MRLGWIGLLASLGGCQILFSPAGPEEQEADAAPPPTWLHTAGSGMDEDGAGGAAEGRVASCGTFRANFRFAEDGDLLEHRGEGDVYLGFFERDGEPRSAGRLGDSDGQRCAGVAMESHARAAVAGAFVGELSVETSEGPVSIQSDQSSDEETEHWDVFVGVFGNQSDLLWLQRVGTRGKDGAASVAKSDDVYVAGQAGGELEPANLSSSGGGIAARLDQGGGEIVWQMGFPAASSADVALESIAARGDAVYVAGWSENDFTVDSCASSASSDARRAFVARIDSHDGSCIWLRELESPGGASARAVGVAGSDVFIAGNVSGALTGFQGERYGAQPSDGGADGFVARYEDQGENGVASWFWRLGGGDIALEDLSVSSSRARLFAAGAFSGEASDGNQVLASRGMRDALLVRLDVGEEAPRTRSLERFGGNGRDAAEAVVSDRERPILRGFFEGTIEGIGEMRTSNGGTDMFTLALPRLE